MEDLATVRTKRLHSLVNNFAAGTARISALSVTLSEVAYRVRREQWSMDYAILKTHGYLPEPLTNFKIAPECRGEFNRQIEKFNSLPRPKLSEFIATWGAGYINIMLATEVGMKETMEALLSSVLIDSWMAFEILASDLWVRAIDFGPSILRKRLISRTLKSEKSDDPFDLVVPEDVPDLKSRPGSALREARKVSFQRLPYIVRNYEIVFGSKVKTLFSENNNYIVVLSAFRNVLIHNAGKVDSTFIKRMKGFPEFASIKPRQKLQLDGELVAKLRETATTVGAKLIHFVDDVMTPT